jgi:hypothetical protein
MGRPRNKIAELKDIYIYLSKFMILFANFTIYDHLRNISLENKEVYL